MRYVSVLVLFFWCTLLPAIDPFTVDFKSDEKEILILINEKQKEPFTLSSLSFSSQNNFSEQEFLYLFGLEVGHEITPQQLAQGILLLKKRGQFESMRCNFTKTENGIALHCDTHSTWMLKDRVLKGISLGKNAYLQYYSMQPGEPFLVEKHRASLEKIQQIFYERGYREASIVELLKYDELTKTVSVSLHCKKGKKFKIEKTILTFTDAQESDHDFLLATLYKKFFKRLESKRYSEESLNAVMKNVSIFLTESGFSKPAIQLKETVLSESKKVVLTFEITLGKKREFIFEGNYFYKEKELCGMITKFGDSVGIVPSSVLAQDIATEYQKNGFWECEIETSENGTGDFFVIEEGPRVKISSVLLKGVTYFDTKKLISVFFKKLTAPRFFNAEKLQEATEQLLACYRAKGFWDVAVVKRSYEQQDENFQQLVIMLSEGPQRFLGSVEIENFESLQLRGPFAAFKNLKTPVEFDKMILTTQRNWLIAYFKKKGFLRVKVEPVLTEKDSVIKLVWKVITQDPITFGKIVVQGAPHVAHSVIANVIGIKEGDLWKKETFQQAYNRVRSLDVFKHIYLYSDQLSSDASSRILVVQLQDDEPFELRTRLGYQQVSKNFALKEGSTYKVGGSLLWRNPTRHADLLRFDVDATRFERNVSGMYQFPFFLYAPLNFSIKGYGNKYSQPLIVGRKTTLYDVIQQGAVFNLTSHGKALSTGLTSGFEWMEINNIEQNVAQAINFKTDLIDKKIPYFFVEPSLFVDLLDDKLNPTKGLFAVASLKGMFPLRDTTYSIKFLVENSIFFPFAKWSDIVCGARFRFGHVFNKAFSQIMPPERFYLGGANSLRGYLPDACPPLGAFTDPQGKQQRVPQGGRTMAGMNFELRVPLTPVFSGVVFQDFGVLAEDITTLTSGNNNLAATGFGIRYMTPIGPLRFDIGWKWHKPFPEDARYAWFLTFGHAF